MRQLIRYYASVSFLSLVALILGGCGKSAPQNQVAAQIHGELISSANNSAAASPAIPVTPAAPAMVFQAKSEVPAPDYTVVGFDKLAAYTFEVDDTPVTDPTAKPDKANDQIPDYVKAFNDKKVSVKGFMLPLKVANGSVSEFLIMKDQSTCCFGAVPKINEWVSVKTAGPGIKPIMDQPVSICGTIHIGATRENGYLVGIYRMDGDKLVTSDN